LYNNCMADAVKSFFNVQADELQRLTCVLGVLNLKFKVILLIS
jgi:hypothetical protein